MKKECAEAISQVAGRKLTKGELDGIEERLHGAIRELSLRDNAAFNAMSPAERASEGAKLAKEWLIRDAVRAHEQTIQEASRKASLFANTAEVKPGLKGQVQSLKNRLVNIEQRTNAISANFFRQIEGLHDADKGKVYGLFTDPEAQKDIVKGLFNEPTTPEARKAADSVKKLMDTVSERYQRAGLTLNKREDYRTPQPQDPIKVSAASKKSWVEDHLGWVDRRAYVKSDGSFMSDKEMRTMLEESWRSIATDGANKRGENETRGGYGLIGTSKNAPRQLFYKNSASWSQAMSKYGRTNNLYELIGSHVRSMSRDIAMAEEFGRNADKNYTQALGKAYEADHATLKKDSDFKRLDTLHQKTKRLYEAYVHPSRPQNVGFANAMTQIRGLMASTQLGSFFGALPDLAGLKVAAEHSGLPAIKTFRKFADGLVAGKEKKDFLHRLGIWQEDFQHFQHRMAEDNLNNGWGTFLNELTHKLSGLNAYDRAMRSGIGRVAMDVLGEFTRSHDTLAQAEGEARLLQNKGVTEDHWKIWKLAKLDKGYSGEENLLTPQAIYDIPDNILDPLIEKRVSERSDIFKKEIEKRNTQNERERGWLGNKSAKFDDLRNRVNRVLQEFDERRQGNIDSLTDAAGARAELIRAQLARAEVEHDIAGYLKTETAQDRIANFLRAVEDGADTERQVIKQRIHPDNLPDAVIETYQKNPSIGELADRTVENYGRGINKKAEQLGERRARAEARIKDAQKRIDQMQKSHDSEVMRREGKADKRFKPLLKELIDTASEYANRAAMRKDYAEAFQAKLGKVLDEERANAKDTAAEKLLEVVYREMQFGARGGSPTSIEDKVLMGTDKYPAGTIMGEFNRFILQFKSVPVGIFRQHWETANSLPTWGAKTAYMAKFAGYGMLMGALATELKAIVNGQNPRNMNVNSEDGRKFWTEALASGGGLGIYGDLFANGQTMQGAGAETLFGPGFTTLSDIVREGRQALEDAEKGESEHPYALKALRIIRRNALPLMNLWYLKAAFNRLVYDHAQEQLAPGTLDKQRQRMESRGVSYWWPIDSGIKDIKTPDISKMWEE